jgi:hypothetical protein
MNDLAEQLQSIARAVHRLHEDAWSSVRAVAHQPIVENEFTRPHLVANDRVTTHPHLRHATGAKATNQPVGDQQVLGLYRHTIDTITGAYDALIPPAQRQRPRGAGDGPARPDDLVSMLAQLHQVIGAWHRMGQRAIDLQTVLEDHVRQLEQLATALRGWHTTWTPPPAFEICTNPDGRRRCIGHPVIANRLCRSCYDHERYRARRLDRDAS